MDKKFERGMSRGAIMANYDVLFRVEFTPTFRPFVRSSTSRHGREPLTAPAAPAAAEN
jgi:hypothetical protein